ncbi:hypothetical protein GCM10009679_23390 [Saccharothrix algeriensis]
MAMIPSVNRIFLRRSGVLNALTKAESNFFLLRAAPGAGGCGKGRDGEVLGVAGTAYGRPSPRHAQFTRSWDRTLTVPTLNGQVCAAHICASLGPDSRRAQ